MPSVDLRRSVALLGEEHFFPKYPSQWRLSSEDTLDSYFNVKPRKYVHHGPNMVVSEKLYDPDMKSEKKSYDRDLESEFMHDVHEISNMMNKEKALYSDDISTKVIPQSIGRDTVFDVVPFLCGEKRDYLVRNNGGERVSVESLRGKFVLVCCLFAPTYWAGYDPMVAHAVSSICSDLYNMRSDFEMVIVAKMRPGFADSTFSHFMSGFPASCLSVPLWDVQSREYICKYLDFTSKPKGIFVDTQEKMVLWHQNLFQLMMWGADAFPFTDEACSAISHEETTTPSKDWCLESLLCCYPCNILGKNPGGGLENVYISQLKEKVVGLYLCEGGDLLPMIEKVYDDCRAQGKDFEIVVVYLPFNPRQSEPQFFQELINQVLEKRKISWWVLPYRSWVSRRLSRLTLRDGYNSDRLIIVGPHGEFVEPYGEVIIQKYGVGAYPFSREIMVQREVQRIRTITLESLLKYGSRDFVLRNNHDTDANRVPVSALHGRNVLLYLDFVGDLSEDVYGPLIKYYSEIKAKDPGFEVVFVNLGRLSISSYESLYAMPWLVCPYDSEHSNVVPKAVFVRCVRSSLIAFGTDGKICSITAHQHLHSLGTDAHPTYGNNLRKEVIACGNLHLSTDAVTRFT